MSVVKHSWSLPGYESCGTILITYKFNKGIQGLNHPRPGQRYHGTTQYGYLPDNSKGQKVLKLLKKAFDQKLTFTIGQSTTGKNDCVILNDIPHKTSTTGGSTNYVKTSIFVYGFYLFCTVCYIYICSFRTFLFQKEKLDHRRCRILRNRWVIVSCNNCAFICLSVMATLIQIT